MSSPDSQSNKRPRPEDSGETPAKRGRGRPRKDPNALPPPPKDTNAPKRGRGRPRKDPNAPRPPPKHSNTLKRPRGRPRKDTDAGVFSRQSSSSSHSEYEAHPSASTLASKSRPTSDSHDVFSEATEANLSDSPVGGGVAGRYSNRPTETTSPLNGSATPALGKQTSKAKSNPRAKTGAGLTDIVGTYSISCPKVESNWPETAGQLELAISTLPGTKSTLIASFHLGILEGTMLLAADVETLERTRYQMIMDEQPSPDNSPPPPLFARTIYFTWRGRETVEGKIHPGTSGTQTGHLVFPNECSSFKGRGAFPYLGVKCDFKGKKVDEKVSSDPKPWNYFSEENS